MKEMVLEPLVHSDSSLGSVGAVITIRDSRPGEAPALEALQRRALDLWKEHREELAAHPEALAVPAAWIDDGKVRVAEDDDGRIVGFATALDDEIDSVYVDPGLMGGGIGRLLLEDVAARARAAGHSDLNTSANANSFRFYERMGFVKTGEAPSRFGPGLRMRLDL